MKLIIHPINIFLFLLTLLFISPDTQAQTCVSESTQCRNDTECTNNPTTSPGCDTNVEYFCDIPTNRTQGKCKKKSELANQPIITITDPPPYYLKNGEITLTFNIKNCPANSEILINFYDQPETSTTYERRGQTDNQGSYKFPYTFSKEAESMFIGAICGGKESELNFALSTPEPTTPPPFTLTVMPTEAFTYQKIKFTAEYCRVNTEVQFVWRKDDNLIKVEKIDADGDGDWGTATIGKTFEPGGYTVEATCLANQNVAQSSFIVEVPPLVPPPPPPCKHLADGGCLTVRSAIGDIHVDPPSLIRSLLGIMLSISGSIALVLLIYSGYLLMTSSGNSDQVQKARETLTSVTVGLLFVIFSFVVLQVIAVDILRIPGFDK